MATSTVRWDALDVFRGLTIMLMLLNLSPGSWEFNYGLGSWPPVVDRAVIGVEHFFPYWPVDGKVVFDPEGILSTWPACFNVLFGALVGLGFSRGRFGFPALTFVIVGVVMMAVALALQGLCPLIKNIWTGTFALFSSGFSLALLGLLMPVSQAPGARPLFAPTRIFGENPLLAYILCFLIAPVIDLDWISQRTLGSGAQPVPLRAAGQAWFAQFLEPRAASLAFGLCGLAVVFAVLLVCHRKRWILKL